ncbi:MAG: hypothetical protein GX442_09400 [Candidatus Riflebacteria bacterium]|nr:hypothetical protein [Candidatus Riflebacteria bacterium]
MPPTTACVRHGLYIPQDLLARIKEIARREKTSINKKIERIIQEWFDFQKSKDLDTLSREEFHRLPAWRKKQILAEQARAALSFYTKENEWAAFPTDDVHEY